MVRTAEAARRIRARQLKRQRGNPAGFDFTWQKWIRCQLCGKPYCCNNYPDRKPRSHKLFGYRCCMECWYKARPVIAKLVKDKVLKVKVDVKKGELD